MSDSQPRSTFLLCAKEVAERLGVKKAKLVYELWDLGPAGGGMASVRIGKKQRARRCSEADIREYLDRCREAELAKLQNRQILKQS